MTILGLEPRRDEPIYSALARHTGRMVLPRNRCCSTHSAARTACVNGVAGFDPRARSATLAGIGAVGAMDTVVARRAPTFAWRHTRPPRSAWLSRPEGVVAGSKGGDAHAGLAGEPPARRGHKARGSFVAGQHQHGGGAAQAPEHAVHPLVLQGGDERV